MISTRSAPMMMEVLLFIYIANVKNVVQVLICAGKIF